MQFTWKGTQTNAHCPCPNFSLHVPPEKSNDASPLLPYSCTLARGHLTVGWEWPYHQNPFSFCEPLEGLEQGQIEIGMDRAQANGLYFHDSFWIF